MFDTDLDIKFIPRCLYGTDMKTELSVMNAPKQGPLLVQPEIISVYSGSRYIVTTTQCPKI